MKKIVSVLFVILLTQMVWAQKTNTKSTIVLKDCSGQQYDIQLRNRTQPLLLVVFNNGCPSCYRELAALGKHKATIVDSLDTQLVVFTARVKKKTCRDVKKYRPTKDLNQPLLLDTEGNMLPALSALEGIDLKKLSIEIKGKPHLRVPQSILIDASGRVVYHKWGYSSGDEKKLLETLKKLKVKSGK